MNTASSDWIAHLAVALCVFVLAGVSGRQVRQQVLAHRARLRHHINPLHLPGHLHRQRKPGTQVSVAALVPGSGARRWCLDQVCDAGAWIRCATLVHDSIVLGA